MSQRSWRSPGKVDRPSVVVLTAAVASIAVLLTVAVTTLWVGR